MVGHQARLEFRIRDAMARVGELTSERPCKHRLENELTPFKRPQFLVDIWRCNDQIIKFIIQKFYEDLYWPDYHLRTPIFRILAENKLHILVEMKDMVNFDGILYQLGFVRFYLQMHF